MLAVLENCIRRTRQENDLRESSEKGAVRFLSHCNHGAFCSNIFQPAVPFIANLPPKNHALKQTKEPFQVWLGLCSFFSRYHLICISPLFYPKLLERLP